MFEFLFQPLISLGPAVAVPVFAAIMLVIINIFYKVLINQREAKAVKERQKELGRQIGEARKAKEMDKMNTLMKEQLSENSKTMRMTMKPMLVSFVIVIIFLPWMNSVYGDVNVQLANGTAVANLHGVNHTVSIAGNATVIGGATPYEEMPSIQLGCDSKCYVTDEGTRIEARTEGEMVTLAPIVATLPFALPLFGHDVGWLAWYILVSIPLVIVIRKLMKIYV